MGTNSAAIPTTPRGSSTLGLSNTPRITGLEVRRTQHLFQHPELLGPVGPRHTGTLPDQWHKFLLVCLGWYPEQTLGTNSAAIPTTHRGSSTPRSSNMPRIKGYQDPRSLVTPVSQGLRGNLIPRSSDTLRISGSKNHRIIGSERLLNSEEF